MWDNRLKNNSSFKQKVTVDRTDLLCWPPSDDDEQRSWIFHKFKKPAVHYEIAISIQSGDIVWANGPWRAGRYPDITIFRLGGLKDLLLECDERAEADKGYRGEPEVIDLPHKGPRELLLAKKRARIRHETCNKRFKNWSCLNTSFRHGVDLHSDCMHVVVVLTQLAIEDGQTLFNAAFVEYK